MLTLAELNQMLNELNVQIADIHKEIDEKGDQEVDKEIKIQLSALEKQAASIKEKIDIEEKALQALNDFNDAMRRPKTPTTKVDYLKSKEALKDYADLVRSHAGQSMEDVTKAWMRHLKNKGITNPDILMPQAVIEAIVDAFEMSGSILASFNRKFGVYAWANFFNSSTDSAQGWPTAPSDTDTKVEQSITLDKREIDCQYVYKYITVPRQILRQGNDIVLNYILSELPMHVIRTVEKAAIIGCPELTGDNAITEIIPIVGDDAAYVSSITGTENGYVDLLNAIASITAPGMLYLVTSRQWLTNLQMQTTASGQFLFPPGANLGQALGLAGIFTPDWMTAANGAVLYSGQSYVYIGDNMVEEHRNFILAKNAEEFLAEIQAGGALMLPKSAAVISQYVATP